ncbi:DUF2953 domain-containing protein [Anaerocolumna sp. MB42-C2]|uniref:DUF2953 domain-containing protein n=1 Tax=Anaerocolumna sp. MB42-C2 TaxID=3070997 RepID=UPI0027E1FC8E|nr:DUF2953 domain-containing protein [Anaerocolumna sp. MB42-C2]WMJ87910.1 DUF2953 domain-containing protein [Anaerocolumna sp. MB42-C2]
MLHIVLFLLKIIGIILASILGLLIFLILVVLLVPIRYRINADNKAEIRAEVKISWLLRIINFLILYSDNELLVRLKLFGRVFYDSNNPKSNERQQKSKKIRKNQKSEKITEIKGNSKTEINAVKEIKNENINKRIAETENTEVKTEIKTETKTEIKPEIEIIHSINNTSVSESKNAENDKIEIIKEQSKDKITKLTNKTPADKIKTEVRAAEINGTSGDEPIAGSDPDTTEKFNKKTERRFLADLKKFFHKVKAFFINIPERFRGIWAKLINLKEKLLNISEKWDRIKAFLKDDSNKKALSRSFLTIKKVLKHIRPTKIKMELEFGTGDPCSTGQILGVMAAFYSFYGQSVSVIPNFEDEILEGSIFCIGRIRLLTLLIICIQLLLDKNFRKLLKNLKALKEDL